MPHHHGNNTQSKAHLAPPTQDVSMLMERLKLSKPIASVLDVQVAYPLYRAGLLGAAPGHGKEASSPSLLAEFRKPQLCLVELLQQFGFKHVGSPGSG